MLNEEILIKNLALFLTHNRYSINFRYYPYFTTQMSVADCRSPRI